jgi:hypothetical protein
MQFNETLSYQRLCSHHFSYVCAKSQVQLTGIKMEEQSFNQQDRIEMFEYDEFPILIPDIIDSPPSSFIESRHSQVFDEEEYRFVPGERPDIPGLGGKNLQKCFLVYSA